MKEQTKSFRVKQPLTKDYINLKNDPKGKIDESIGPSLRVGYWYVTAKINIKRKSVN